AVRRKPIDAPQHPVEKCPAAPRRDRLEAAPQPRVGAWTGKQAARQRAEIEPGAAREDRQLAARVNTADRGRRIARVLCGGVLVGRLDDVDEMVRDVSAIRGGDLAGADVEAAVGG